jgi:hypothetical protein
MPFFFSIVKEISSGEVVKIYWILSTFEVVLAWYEGYENVSIALSLNAPCPWISAMLYKTTLLWIKHCIRILHNYQFVTGNFCIVLLEVLFISIFKV